MMSCCCCFCRRTNIIKFAHLNSVYRFMQISSYAFCSFISLFLFATFDYVIAIYANLFSSSAEKNKKMYHISSQKATAEGKKTFFISGNVHIFIINVYVFFLTLCISIYDDNKQTAAVAMLVKL